MASEPENVYPLKGTKENPAREPKAKTGKGSIGDVGLNDAMIIVVIAWLVLLFLAYSLRHHNV
jgi:hypothetical protein